jgi:hypothetical protein
LTKIIVYAKLIIVIKLIIISFKFQKGGKMEKELKEGQEITQKELFKMGWEKIGPYSEFVVFCKGEKTLFFDPKRKKIERIF